MALLSGFRSKKRDIETDTARVVPILDAVQVAFREAEKELQGLRVRVRETTDRAAFLFGSDIESASDADPGSKAELEDAESFISRAELRDRYLERQVSALSEIRSILGQIVRPETPSTDRQ